MPNAPQPPLQDWTIEQVSGASALFLKLAIFKLPGSGEAGFERERGVSWRWDGFICGLAWPGWLRPRNWDSEPENEEAGALGALGPALTSPQARDLLSEGCIAAVTSCSLIVLD